MESSEFHGETVSPCIASDREREREKEREREREREKERE